MGARRNNEGGWDLTFSDGETYVGAPEDIARESFPEDFPDPLAEAEQQWYESHTPPQAGPPPMEPVAQPDPGQDAHDAYARIRAGALPPQQQMEQEQAQDPSLLGQAGLAPGDSVSSSESFRGTLPYEEAETADPSQIPDFSEEKQMHRDANFESEGSYIEQQNNLRANQQAQGRLTQERRDQAYETMERAQEIHDDAREEANRREEEIKETLSNVSRMDMNKIWKDADATVHFAGYLAAGIAGFLNPTGKNSVIEQMQGLADRSAREQAANIKLEMQQVEGMESSLGRFKEQAESDEQMYLKTRATLERSMIDQITAKKEEFSSIITNGKLDQLIIAGEKNLAKTLTGYKQGAYNMHTEQQKQEDLNARAAATLRQRRSEVAWNRKNKLAMQKKADDRYNDKDPAVSDRLGTALFSLPDGSTVYTKGGPLGLKIDKIEAREFREKRMTAIQLTNHGRKLQVLLNEYSRLDRVSPGGERKAEVEQEVAELLLAMRPVMGANLTESEAKSDLKRWGNPKSVLQNPKSANKLVKRALDSISADLETTSNIYGLEVATPMESGINVRSARQGENLMDLGSLDIEGSPAEQGLGNFLEDMKGMKYDWDNAVGAEGKADAAVQMTIKFEKLMDRSDGFDMDARENAGMRREIESVLSEIPAGVLTQVQARSGELLPRIAHGQTPLQAFQTNIEYHSDMKVKKRKAAEAHEALRRAPGTQASGGARNY